MRRAVRNGLAVLAVAGTQCALAWPGAAGLHAGEFFAAASSGAAPAKSSSAQGYLGVDVRDVGESRGAEIVLVDHDAPAGKAGLREHDVVLRMNGEPIVGEEQIRRLLRESPPGKKIVLVISRDGREMTVTAQMASREAVEKQAWEQHFTVPEPQDGFAPDAPSAPSAPPAPLMRGGNSFIGTILMSPAYTGVFLEQMSAQLAQYFGAPNGEGLLVRSVAANSPGAQAGMQAGDVVVEADAKPVANSSDWNKALRNSRGQALTITILRDKKEQTLKLMPDGKKRSSVEEPEDGSGGAVARTGFSWMPTL